MASAAQKLAPTTEAAIAPIREQVMNAIREMFDRAVGNGIGKENLIIGDKKVVVDKKTDLDPPLPVSGPLQDCEFGMILLLTHEWMGEDFFATINEEVFDRAIEVLVASTVTRVLVRMGEDEGGARENAPFFTGKPYSKYTKKGSTRYSANLDAAMITIGFLVPAIEQFHKKLFSAEHGIRGVSLPEWVVTLRDAALFVIIQGLKYAQDCRVTKKGRFRGFTCDPESKDASPEDGHLERDEDRLFFTWTACETINDLIEWRDSYLAEATPPPPPDALAQLKPLIDDLETTLALAAEWCQDRFLPEFERFEAEDTKEIVRDIIELNGKALNQAQKDRVAQMANHVQHVYHISQYAAIRSLVPESVTPKEVGTIIDKLDRLVSRSIISSKLDEAGQPELFPTLTRNYSLGKWGTYTDDAWYPLVVRSLSGLLSRTLNDIGRGPEVQKLIQTFQRSLKGHVEQMGDRRPKDSQDSKLWSFAGGQPYLLYATQRTIFAFIEYANLLKAVGDFAEEPSASATQEDDLSLLVARKLADDLLRPVIKDWLARRALSTQTPASNGRPAVEFVFPEQSWAVEVLRQWLTRFTKDFRRLQVAAILEQKSQLLILIQKVVEHYQPSDVITKDPDTSKKNGALKYLASLKERYEEILNMGKVGQKLAHLTNWDNENLTMILFEYLLDEYVGQPIGRLLQVDSTELWKLIEEAKKTQAAINRIDPTAVVP